MTLRECCNNAESKLRRHYPDTEARWMVRIIFEHLKSYTPVDLVIRADDEISDFIAGKVDKVVDRLLLDEPIQYIFGQARFYGLDFEVTKATLIPRPETEELVEMIVRDADGRTDLRVLDVGTGSGCIAIALARNLRFPQITAVDISNEALEVARRNAAKMKTRIAFDHADALHLEPPHKPLFDIIVSNPPYIAMHERAAMSRNVVDHEPASALFVPDDDPLMFYNAIARYATQALVPDGRLYFEINPLYADMLCRSLESYRFNRITVTADMQHHNRFVSATLPSL